MYLTCVYGRAIVVINPGNPTGQVLSRQNIEDIIRFAHKVTVTFLIWTLEFCMKIKFLIPEIVNFLFTKYFCFPLAHEKYVIHNLLPWYMMLLSTIYRNFKMTPLALHKDSEFCLKHKCLHPYICATWLCSNKSHYTFVINMFFILCLSLSQKS